MDLDGSTNDAADFSTTDNFATGTYSLSFDISGSQRPDTNTINVAFGDLNEDFTLSGSDPWITIVRTVTLDSLDDLTFSMLGSDNSGILLDNVTVSEIPIPGAFLLFGSALLGLGVLKRGSS